MKRFSFIAGLILCIACSTFDVHAQYHLELLDSNAFELGEGVVLSKTSFRGLSVVNDNTIWISGSRGTVARSTNGGKTVAFTRLKGYERSDFRDIQAFDDKRAVMMSSGTPAYILRTTDGGQTWKEVYKNTDSAYFLDAMDFWDDRNGVIVGDPVNGHFVLLETGNGGETWKQRVAEQTPAALPGEAIFAASGTSLRCLKGKHYGFVTGGDTSRFFVLKRNSPKATIRAVPIIHGKNSQGAFSFACTGNENLWLFAGGDYLNDTQTTSANFYYTNRFASGERISASENLHGYKSCIEVLDEKKGKHTYGYPHLIATGTSGTEIGYRVCTFISTEFSFTKAGQGFHVVRKAKKGSAVFLAGPGGKIARLARL